MKVEIERRSDRIPKEIEDYILKKLKRLEKLIKGESSIKYVLSYQKGNFFTEISLEDKGNTFQAHASSHDIKLSINEGLEKLKHQFKKFKGRIIERKNTKKTIEF